MAQRVYLDVDTGVDDALAILLAVMHPDLDVRGITTVDGNVDIDNVTRNTLQVLELAGASHIPVAVGARQPLVVPIHSAAVVHGDDGLGGANLPAPGMEPVSQDAVAFLRDALLAEPEPVTIIPLAPLTNIALLLQTAPEVKSKIKELAIMGGAFLSGNATAVAEFNIYHDPDAADVVFRSGVPILMYGLEVFGKVNFTGQEASEWFATNGDGEPVTPPQTPRDLVAHLLRFGLQRWNRQRERTTIGDAGCVACVIDRSRLTTELLPVFVETGGSHSRGQTVVDRRPKDHLERRPTDTPGSQINVALDIDGDYYRQLFRQAITQ